MPEMLRELLYSPEHAEIVRHICENNHLNDDKTGTVLGIVGGVIMGFVHVQDLDHQIARNLDINTELARSIASDVRERVLKRFENEIEDAFQPSLPSEMEENGEAGPQEKIIEITETSSESEGAPISIPIESSETAKTPGTDTAPATSAPFILHEEKKTETASGGRSIFRGFSIPLGFFKPKNPVMRSDDSPTVKIETPGKSEKRVVNYSELRTSLSPFEGQQSFIHPVRNSPPLGPSGAQSAGEISNGVNPSTPAIFPAQTESAAPAMSMAAIPAVPEPAPIAMPETKTTAPNKIAPTQSPETGNILGMIKKTQPKVEGNTIDLS